jgi:hypothetical protein
MFALAARRAKLPFTGMSAPGVERKWGFETFRFVAPGAS